MKLITLLAAAIMTAIGFSAPVKADSLTWSIQSEYRYIVHLEFYSQDRNHVWPGKGQVFVLDDYDTEYFTLQCRTGEYICFGAWVDGDTNTYWGVGPGDTQYCPTCCAYCGRGDVNPISFGRGY